MPKFPACEQCPTREGCEVAGFCVIESRFGRADLSIGDGGYAPGREGPRALGGWSDLPYDE
jgi:hypothetical protein